MLHDNLKSGLLIYSVCCFFFTDFRSMAMSSYLFPQVLLQFCTRGLVLTFLGRCNIESSLE